MQAPPAATHTCAAQPETGHSDTWNLVTMFVQACFTRSAAAQPSSSTGSMQPSLLPTHMWAALMLVTLWVPTTVHVYSTQPLPPAAARHNSSTGSAAALATRTLTHCPWSTPPPFHHKPTASCCTPVTAANPQRGACSPRPAGVWSAPPGAAQRPQPRRPLRSPAGAAALTSWRVTRHDDSDIRQPPHAVLAPFMRPESHLS